MYTLTPKISRKSSPQVSKDQPRRTYNDQIINVFRKLQKDSGLVGERLPLQLRGHGLILVHTYQDQTMSYRSQ